MARGRLSQLLLPVGLSFGLAGGLLMLAGGPGRAQSQPSTPTPSPRGMFQLDRGRILYLRDCAWCHGAGLEGTDFGPSLIGVGAASTDFVLSTGRMPIDRPIVQPPRRPAAYTLEEQRAIVRHVATIGG